MFFVQLIDTGKIRSLNGNQTEINTFYAFAAPVIYALILFAASFPFNYLQRFIDGKIYDRRNYYLAIKQLHAVTNSTIAKVNGDDYAELKKMIIFFQIFTGRDEATLNAIPMEIHYPFS